MEIIFLVETVKREMVSFDSSREPENEFYAELLKMRELTTQIGVNCFLFNSFLTLFILLSSLNYFDGYTIICNSSVSFDRG